MVDNKIGWKVLRRAEAKNPAGTERLFNRYCQPITRSWDDHERELTKEAALKIFDSEFSSYVEEDGLKGHARHKKTYPVDVGNLIIALIKYAHFDRLVNLGKLVKDQAG